MSFCRTAILLLGLVVVAGCSSRAPHSGGIPANLGANGLEELAKVYQYIAENRAPIPPHKEALAEYEANLPTAWDKIVRGDYVVMWGAGYSKNGSGNVLAYERSAESSGGLVLMQDGTVKQMSAAELKAAPKAR